MLEIIKDNKNPISKTVESAVKTVHTAGQATLTGTKSIRKGAAKTLDIAGENTVKVVKDTGKGVGQGGEIAIDTVQPWGVDVSSGGETDLVKDTKKIYEFATMVAGKGVRKTWSGK